MRVATFFRFALNTINKLSKKKKRELWKTEDIVSYMLSQKKKWYGHDRTDRTVDDGLGPALACNLSLNFAFVARSGNKMPILGYFHLSKLVQRDSRGGKN